MRLPLVFIALALGVSFGADERGLIVSSGENSTSVAERRAKVMGSKLDSFETMKGRIYQDVKVTEINDGGISFTHADGAARLRFEDLSPEQRRYFGITGEAAAEIYRKEREVRIAYEKQVEEREAARKMAAEQEAEVRLLALEKAAKMRAERAETFASRSIPALPEIKRVDSVNFSRRSYRSYRSSYGYTGNYYSGYYPRYRSYGGGYFGRSRGYCGSRTPGLVIRR